MSFSDFSVQLMKISYNRAHKGARFICNIGNIYIIMIN